MSNGYLPMYIHKRLTFDVELRICAGTVIWKKKLAEPRNMRLVLRGIVTMLGNFFF